MEKTILSKNKMAVMVAMMTAAVALTGCNQSESNEKDTSAIENFQYTQHDEEEYALFANRILRFHTDDIIETVESNFNKSVKKRASIRTSIESWLDSYPDGEGTIPMPQTTLARKAYIYRFAKEYGVGSASFNEAERQHALSSWKRALKEAQEDVFKYHTNPLHKPSLVYDGPELPRRITVHTIPESINNNVKAY